MSGVNFSFHEANVNLSGEPGPGWVIVNLTGNFQAGTAAIIGVVAAVHGIEALAMTTCAPASTR